MSRRDAAARALDELLRTTGHQAAVDLRVTITPTHGAGPMLLVKGGHLHRAWEGRVWVRPEHFHTPPAHRDAAESGVLSMVIENADDPSGWLQQDEAAQEQVLARNAEATKREAGKLADLQRRYGDGPKPKFASGGYVAGPMIVDEAPGAGADWSGYAAPSVPQEEIDRRVSLAIRHLAAALGVEVEELLTVTVTPFAVTANVLEPGERRAISRSTRRGAFYTYRPLGWRKPKGDA